MAAQNTGLGGVVVCFMLDGSDRYKEMTRKAISSFQKMTPNVSVGLLVNPNNAAVPDFIASLPNPQMVNVRHFDEHFPGWNPTQYKLDLAKFRDKFETVFWLDSDIIVYKDMSQFLLEFHNSKKNFAFAKDHVTNSEEFKKRWSAMFELKTDDIFIAQACFMGFKTKAMPEFFKEWENIWRDWITPSPFVKYPNPYPSFPGSAFCIEQYALGMTIRNRLLKDFDTQVLVIPRNQIVLRDSAVPLTSLFSGNTHHGEEGNVDSVTLDRLHISFPSSDAQPHIPGLPSFFMVPTFGGVNSSYAWNLSSSYNWSSYGSSSYPLSSYGETSYFPSSYTETSYGLTSHAMSSYGQSSAYFLFQGDRSSSNFGLQSSYGGEGSSAAPQNANFVVMDNFNDQVIHYYSINYERLNTD